MKSLKEILLLSEQYLLGASIERPRFNAEEIIAHVLGCKRMDLYLDFDKPLIDKELQDIRALLRRRAQKIPLPYLFGEVEFYDCSIQVNQQVLIPRPETEILVDLVVKDLEKIPSLKNKVLWDLCTGSGCIAIAMKKRFPDLLVIGSDISTQALEVTAKNSANNGVSVEWRQGNFLSPFAKEKADYILCNPPYISSEEFLDLSDEVKCEPTLALVAENRGLFFYEQLAKAGFSHLQSGGKIFLEIGKDQGKEVKKLFSAFPKTERTDLLCDWAGHDRFFFLEIE